MDHGAQVLFALFVAFISAQIGREIGQRLKLPSVVGEIAAGVIIGPSVLNLLPKADLPTLQVFAELGAVFLLFAVGLETRLADLRKVGKSSFLVGSYGVLFPFIGALAYSFSVGFSVPKGLFFAAAMVATSAGITARVLQDLKVLNRQESKVILGAAVIDDVLAMLLLGVVSSIEQGKVDLAAVGIVFVQAVAFIVIVAFFGGSLMRRSSEAISKPINPQSPLAISLVICIGLAVLSAKIGLAAIIGAFLAGMIVAETTHRKPVENQMTSINELIVPFFFVVTGSQVDIKVLGTPAMLLFVVAITGLAVFTKLAGGYLGAKSLGKESALVVGIGMVPRGEVGIIVASLGLQNGAFDQKTYAVIIAMSLLTAIVAPPLLERGFKRVDEQERLKKESLQPANVGA